MLKGFRPRRSHFTLITAWSVVVSFWDIPEVSYTSGIYILCGPLPQWIRTALWSRQKIFRARSEKVSQLQPWSLRFLTLGKVAMFPTRPPVHPSFFGKPAVMLWWLSRSPGRGTNSPASNCQLCEWASWEVVLLNLENSSDGCSLGQYLVSNSWVILNENHLSESFLNSKIHRNHEK